MHPVLQTALISLTTGLILLVAGYALGSLRSRRDRKTAKVLNEELLAIEKVKERDQRITELERTVAQLEERAANRDKSAVPIEAAMTAMLIHKLTNAHTPEADALLKKLTDETLTADDAAKLAKAMVERSTDQDQRISEAQRIAAEILPGVIRLRELAKEESAGKVKTLLVTVPETKTVGAQDGGVQQEEKGN